MNKEKIDIGFVILHYQTIDDTCNCLESIKKNIDTKLYKIVVVDNCSPNHTGVELIEKYKDNDSVHIIINQTNYGFSKGNNIGYQYIKNNYDASFIAILNNDTTVCANLFEKLNKAYLDYDFYVLGPKIINKDGKSVNPVRYDLISAKEVRKIINSYNIRRLMYYMNLTKLYYLLKNCFWKNKTTKEQDLNQINVQLNGSALFFSIKYINEKDGFCELTFMYFEEDVLYYECIKNGYKTLYYPDIVINHYEESSTRYSKSKGYELFKIKEGKKSAKKLLKIIEEGKQ